MTVGCLGTFEFSVSSEYVKTFNELSWSGSARYSAHARHGTTALTEFTGLDPEELSFECVLDVSLGISDVMKEIDKLRRIMERAEVRPLVIGNKYIGRYRWVVVSYRVTPTAYDGRGVILRAKVDLNLKEYLKK